MSHMEEVLAVEQERRAEVERQVKEENEARQRLVNDNQEVSEGCSSLLYPGHGPGLIPIAIPIPITI